MPWQGQLLIGQSVKDYGEVVEIFRKLGVSHPELFAQGEKLKNAIASGLDKKLIREIESDLWELTDEVSLPRTIVHKGVEHKVEIAFRHEGEGGAEFPTLKMYGDDDLSYTDACVFFSLTSRYRGAVLDAKHERGGRPEPFEFDPQDIVDILAQVRVWWPEAKAMIWTIWY